MSCPDDKAFLALHLLYKACFTVWPRHYTLLDKQNPLSIVRNFKNIWLVSIEICLMSNVLQRGQTTFCLTRRIQMFDQQCLIVWAVFNNSCHLVLVDPAKCATKV